MHIRVCKIRGQLAGKRDVITAMETFYADFSLDADSRLRVMQVMEEVGKTGVEYWSLSCGKMS